MSKKYSNLTSLLANIVDNRGKSVPVSDTGFPLIATNCIKHSSIYPTFENIRYVNDDIKNNWFRTHPEPNDIIFVNKGTPGRVCLVPDPVSFCFAQDMIGFRCDPEKIDYQYLFAILRSEYIQKKIENYHVGLVIPHFKKGDLDSLNIPRMASRAEELAIGELYLTLSKKIELNNRINAELEAMAKTLYDYWFVQFDFPNEEGKPYKSSGGKMVYNSILKREIPLGWKTESILNNCNIIDCLHSKKPDLVWESENYYLLQLENILDNGLIDISEKYYVSQKDYFIWTSRIELKQHDIVMTNAGRTAAFAQIPNHINCGIGRNITAIRPINISPNYFFLSLSSIDIQRQILTSLDNGAFFKSFNVRGIKALQLLRPINKIEHKFEDTIKGIIDKRNLLVKENSELKKLRDWLLPMLMNGQVTVR